MLCLRNWTLHCTKVVKCIEQVSDKRFVFQKHNSCNIQTEWKYKEIRGKE